MSAPNAVRFRKRHLAGFDCRLTTFGNTLAYYGHRLSNGMILGLSGCLCFLYVREAENRLPFDVVGGISDQTLEGLASALNCYVYRGKLDREDPVAPFLRGYLDDGVPVNVAVFRPGLEALRTGEPARTGATSVGFHYVTLTDYDPDGGRFLLFETHTADEIAIGVDDLVSVWFHDRLHERPVSDPYQRCDGYWYAVRCPQTIDDLLPKSIVHSLHRVVHNFFASGWDGLGRPALMQFQSDARDWPARAAEGGRFDGSLALMRVMEGPLTGGGFGRRLFASFLGEAADLLSAPELRVIGRMFRRSAEGWRELVAEVAAAVRGRENGGAAAVRERMHAAVESRVDALVAQELAQMEALRQWSGVCARA